MIKRSYYEELAMQDKEPNKKPSKFSQIAQYIGRFSAVLNNKPPVQVSEPLVLTIETAQEILRKSLWADNVMVIIEKFMLHPSYTNVLADDYLNQAEQIDGLTLKVKETLSDAEENLRVFNQLKEELSKLDLEENEKAQVNSVLAKLRLDIVETESVAQDYLQQAQVRVLDIEERNETLEDVETTSSQLLGEGEKLQLLAKTNDKIDASTKKELIVTGQKLIDQGNSELDRVQKANSMLSDYSILFKSLHYSGSTSNRTQEGTFATEAIGYQIRKQSSNNPLICTLIRVFELVSSCAACRENILRPVDQPVSFIEASECYKKAAETNSKMVLPGKPQTEEDIMVRADIYKTALEKCEEDLALLYKVIKEELLSKGRCSSSKVDSHSYLIQLKHCMTELKEEKEVFQNLLEQSALTL